MTGNNVTIYPSLVDPCLKNWEAATLNQCSSRRLGTIASEYGLTGYSRMPKEEVFMLIYDHMLTEQECEVCDGQCNPAEHLFQPHEAVPTSTSTNKGPTRTSPNSRLRQNDNSPDTPLGESGTSGALFEGQQVSAPENTEQLSMQESIRIGAMVDDETFFEPEDQLQTSLDDSYSFLETSQPGEARSQLQKDAEKFQQELDDIEKRHDEQRRAALEKAKQKANSGPSLAEQVKQQRKNMLAAMQKRKKEKDDAARAEIAQLKAAARPAPTRRSSAPNAPSSRIPATRGTRFQMDEVDDILRGAGSTHVDLTGDAFDDGPITKKSLVDCMSVSVVKAIEAMEAKKGRTMSLGAVDLDSFNGVPDGAPNTGKLALKTVPNRFMAERLGLAPPPNLSIEGDLTSLDTKKLHKHMMSGANRKPGQFVTRQMTWPEQCLSAQAPGVGKSTYKQLSFPELVDGFIGKALMETNPDTLDMELANKLSFLRELATMSYSLDHQSILTISERFLRGWENCSWEWSNWTRIENLLREARYQELCHSMGRSSNNRRQNNGGQGNGQPPQGNSNVLGISTKFYTENNLCIRFNKGECKESASHKHKTQSYTLHHKCAGCLKAGVEAEDHGVSSTKCTNKPKAPFRQ